MKLENIRIVFHSIMYYDLFDHLSYITQQYVGPVVIYDIIDPHNYLLMTLDGVMLRGIFEHKRLKPAVIRASQDNVQNLAELKQVMNTELKLDKYSSYFNKMDKILQD